MKKSLYLAFVAMLVAGCADTKLIPAPTAEMALKSGQNLETLGRGHTVYITACARCHEPMMPSEISGEEWHVVVPGMSWNAGISDEDEQAVMKYIMAAR